MYARFIDRNTIEQVPKEYGRADGTFVTNYNAVGNNALWIADGFRFVEECHKPLGNYRPVYELLTDSIIQTWEAFTPEVQTVQYSKRRIRVALAGRGLNESFTSFLEGSAELHQAWNDSTVLESSDQLFIQALSAFCTSAGISATVLKDVLAESVAI